MAFRRARLHNLTVLFLCGVEVVKATNQPPPPPWAPGGFWPVLVESGTCFSFGGVPIESEADCDAAAVSLGLPDIWATSVNAVGADKPPFCYLHQGNGVTLYHNTCNSCNRCCDSPSRSHVTLPSPSLHIPC